MLGRQVLYHLSYAPSPFIVFGLFSRLGLALLCEIISAKITVWQELEKGRA
jgi:hypothetical protein